MNRIKKLGCALVRLPRRDKQLVALCYAAFFAVSLLVSLYSFAEDRVQRALGNVTETEISAADFEWTDLEQSPGGALVTTSADPRMVLRDPPVYVRGVRVEALFRKKDPGEFCIFYKPRPGMEDFDANYRVWARVEADGSYTFALPRGKIYGLRLDPGIYAGIEMEITGITLNPQRSFGSYFAPSRLWLLCQLVAPALAASAIQCAAEAFFALKKGGRLSGGKERWK
ncbi:hypothetical protein H8S23_03905 [Anaerofilum sp. BX8]|uniref:Uncharacterized protein n=1 Tax=Anaerofilum hominis TaxID=2763016 RepID=A0A923L146_9FIRM|nr:hypothetical protein [Anaerofilum hominis]MBC5580643.1 hypothetical protein [Anaerofilum hominis]